jgi:hypothetical protein
MYLERMGIIFHFYDLFLMFVDVMKATRNMSAAMTVVTGTSSNACKC